jgi:hypothetical protein
MKTKRTARMHNVQCVKPNLLLKRYAGCWKVSGYE